MSARSIAERVGPEVAAPRPFAAQMERLDRTIEEAEQRLEEQQTLIAQAALAGRDTARDAFELRKNRIGVSGNFFKTVEYEVERELTDKKVDAGKTKKSPWKDVYVNVKSIQNAQIQAGRFKVPFGGDALTSMAQSNFVYRSLGARYLAPSDR